MWCTRLLGCYAELEVAPGGPKNGLRASLIPPRLTIQPNIAPDSCSGSAIDPFRLFEGKAS